LQWHTSLTKAGLRVPEDVSLCGIHGQPNVLAVPDMTAVDVPYAELGRAALDLVIRRIKCPTLPVQRVGYQGIFIEGKTVTRPRVI
jgi:DNA-binding LacI/PurR family transcriptional regulator